MPKNRQTEIMKTRNLILKFFIDLQTRFPSCCDRWYPIDFWKRVIHHTYDFDDIFEITERQIKRHVPHLGSVHLSVEAGNKRTSIDCFFLSSRLRCLVVVFSAFFCVVWLGLSFYVENILTSYSGVWTLIFFARLFVCLPGGCVMIGLVMTSHVLP